MLLINDDKEAKSTATCLLRVGDLTHLLKVVNHFQYVSYITCGEAFKSWTSQLRSNCSLAELPLLSTKSSPYILIKLCQFSHVEVMQPKHASKIAYLFCISLPECFGRYSYNE